MNVTLKDAILQLSRPRHHAAELKEILTAHPGSVSLVLYAYSDGGPDHSSTFLLVQLSLICLYALILTFC